MLDIQNITKRYGTHTAIDKVNITVPRGTVFGLLGPNGAGKSTLIRIVNQIISADEGTVLFDGEPLSPRHTAQIGYLPEERGLYRKMKVGEQAMYLAQLKGLSTREAESRLHWWFGHLDIEQWWNRKVEELSKGMQQKVQFVTTVLHEPKLLIFDEPFSGFDPLNAELLKNEILRLRDEGATVVLSTHNMASVEEICDTFALINHSHVVLQGNVREVRQRFACGLWHIEAETCSDIALPANCQIRNKQYNSNLWQADIDIAESDINTLIAAILPQCKLRCVNQILPSMNDIFIKAISE